MHHFVVSFCVCLLVFGSLSCSTSFGFIPGSLETFGGEACLGEGYTGVSHTWYGDGFINIRVFNSCYDEYVRIHAFWCGNTEMSHDGFRNALPVWIEPRTSGHLSCPPPYLTLGNHDYRIEYLSTLLSPEEWF